MVSQGLGLRLESVIHSGCQQGALRAAVDPYLTNYKHAATNTLPALPLTPA